MKKTRKFVFSKNPKKHQKLTFFWGLQKPEIWPNFGPNSSNLTKNWGFGNLKIEFWGGGQNHWFYMHYVMIMTMNFEGGGQNLGFSRVFGTLLIISVTGLPRAGVHGCSKPGPPAQLVLRAFLQFWGGGLDNSTTFPLELSQRPIQYRIAKNPVFFPLKTKNIKIWGFPDYPKLKIFPIFY